MANIELCEYENMSEAVKNKADEVMQKVGDIGDIFKLLAIKDDVFFATDNMATKYLLQETLLPYSTKQRIALLISMENSCKMCVGVHKKVSKILGMSDAQIEEVLEGVDNINCSDNEKILLKFCIKASTKENYKITKEDIEIVKSSGYSEKEIFEAVSVVAYFNYINTLSNTFGLGN